MADKTIKDTINIKDTLFEMLIENRSEKDEKIIISGNIKTMEYSSILLSLGTGIFSILYQQIITHWLMRVLLLINKKKLLDFHPVALEFLE